MFCLEGMIVTSLLSSLWILVHMIMDILEDSTEVYNVPSPQHPAFARPHNGRPLHTGHNFS